MYTSDDWFNMDLLRQRRTIHTRQFVNNFPLSLSSAKTNSVFFISLLNISSPQYSSDIQQFMNINRRQYIVI